MKQSTARPSRRRPPLTIGVFNPKGGVGKTTLVQHLAYMLGERGTRVLVADFDPAGGLTRLLTHKSTAFAYRDLQEQLGRESGYALNDLEQVPPYKPALVRGKADIIDDEVTAACAWQGTLAGDADLVRDVLLPVSILRKAQEEVRPDVTFIDVSPGTGALARAPLLACDTILIPVLPDTFAISSFEIISTKFRIWREEWRTIRALAAHGEVALPVAERFDVAGYAVMRHGWYRDRPTRMDIHWLNELPEAFRSWLDFRSAVPMLAQGKGVDLLTDGDPLCIGRIRDYRSSMQVSQAARLPLFMLRTSGTAFIERRKYTSACRADVEGIVKKLGAALGKEL